MHSSRLPKALAPDHVQYFHQFKLGVDLATGGVRLRYGILHKALDQAVKWGAVTRHVCKATTPPKPNPKETSPLDAEQAKRILRPLTKPSTYSPSRWA